MKHTLNYGQLFTIDQDFTKMQQQHPGITLLNWHKLQLFYQQAANHLEIMKKAFDEIRIKYIEHDADGKPQMIQTDTSTEWVFKKTVSHIATASIITGAQVKAAFEKEMEDFCKSKSFTIQF